MHVSHGVSYRAFVTDAPGRCHRHDEAAHGTCRACGEEFCDHCLVYAYGRGRPPLCIDCALSAFGVRAAGTNVAGTNAVDVDPASTQP